MNEDLETIAGATEPQIDRQRATCVAEPSPVVVGLRQKGIPVEVITTALAEVSFFVIDPDKPNQGYN